MMKKQNVEKIVYLIYKMASIMELTRVRWLNIVSKITYEKVLNLVRLYKTH